MLFYRAALPLSSRTLNFTAVVVRRHLKAIGSRWRKLVADRAGARVHGQERGSRGLAGCSSGPPAPIARTTGSAGAGGTDRNARTPRHTDRNWHAATDSHGQVGLPFAR
jgi:hypothetical protein